MERALPVVAAASTLALAVHWYRTAKRLSAEAAALAEQNSELLCEARLLALELNKEGDPLAIVRDPTLPTRTIERMVSRSVVEIVEEPRRLLSNQMEGVEEEESGDLAAPVTHDDQRRSGAELWKRAAQGMHMHLLKERKAMRPMAVRQLLSSTAPGDIPTKVIGVCGMSCSGKSTVSSVLRAHAAQYKAHVPVICLDDSFFEWMFDEPTPHGQTSVEPPGGGGRLWKNWESQLCINWPQFLRKLRAKIAVHSGYTPYIVVEGFLLLEHPAALEMCDHVVSIEVSKEVAWQRRLSRALAMARGAQDASGMDNYERLDVYALERDFARIRADAAAAVARLGAGTVFPRAHDAAARTCTDLSVAAGAYDWLRLYFEEVIWPEALQVQRHVEEVRAQLGAGEVLRAIGGPEAGAARGKVYTVDGDRSPEDVERATRKIIATMFQ
eukprot:Transcript_30916.p1 GENE.Transcript_30916~~Transcript_30916.p1  ORF type:complete len:441 (-),score=181.40 Transcript_30916:58-1380(-)